MQRKYTREDSTPFLRLLDKARALILSGKYPETIKFLTELNEGQKDSDYVKELLGIAYFLKAYDFVAKNPHSKLPDTVETDFKNAIYHLEKGSDEQNLKFPMLATAYLKTGRPQAAYTILICFPEVTIGNFVSNGFHFPITCPLSLPEIKIGNFVSNDFNYFLNRAECAQQEAISLKEVNHAFAKQLFISAISYYEKALWSAWPSEKYLVNFNLALCHKELADFCEGHEKRKKLDTAVKLLESVIKDSPKNHIYHEKLAEIYFAYYQAEENDTYHSHKVFKKELWLKNALEHYALAHQENNQVQIPTEILELLLKESVPGYPHIPTFLKKVDLIFGGIAHPSFEIHNPLLVKKALLAAILNLPDPKLKQKFLWNTLHLNSSLGKIFDIRDGAFANIFEIKDTNYYIRHTIGTELEKLITPALDIHWDGYTDFHIKSDCDNHYTKGHQFHKKFPLLYIPKSEIHIAHKAADYIENGNYTAAITYLTNKFCVPFKDHHIQFELGKAYFLRAHISSKDKSEISLAAKEDYTNAIQALEESIKTQDFERDKFLAQGMLRSAYIAMGNFQKGHEHAQKAAAYTWKENSPLAKYYEEARIGPYYANQQTNHYNLGVVLQNQGDEHLKNGETAKAKDAFQSATVAYTKALSFKQKIAYKMNTHMAIEHCQTNIGHLSAGDEKKTAYTTAIQNIRAAMQLYPNYSPYYEKLGETNLAAGNLVASLNAYIKAARLNKDAGVDKNVDLPQDLIEKLMVKSAWPTKTLEKKQFEHLITTRKKIIKAIFAITDKELKQKALWQILEGKTFLGSLFNIKNGLFDKRDLAHSNKKQKVVRELERLVNETGKVAIDNDTQTSIAINLGFQAELAKKSPKLYEQWRNNHLYQTTTTNHYGMDMLRDRMKKFRQLIIENKISADDTLNFLSLMQKYQQDILKTHYKKLQNHAKKINLSPIVTQLINCLGEATLHAEKQFATNSLYKENASSIIALTNLNINSSIAKDIEVAAKDLLLNRDMLAKLRELLLKIKTDAQRKIKEGFFIVKNIFGIKISGTPTHLKKSIAVIEEMEKNKTDVFECALEVFYAFSSHSKNRDEGTTQKFYDDSNTQIISILSVFENEDAVLANLLNLNQIAQHSVTYHATPPIAETFAPNPYAPSAPPASPHIDMPLLAKMKDTSPYFFRGNIQAEVKSLKQNNEILFDNAVKDGQVSLAVMESINKSDIAILNVNLDKLKYEQQQLANQATNPYTVERRENLAILIATTEHVINDAALSNDDIAILNALAIQHNSEAQDILNYTARKNALKALLKPQPVPLTVEPIQEKTPAATIANTLPTEDKSELRCEEHSTEDKSELRHCEERFLRRSNPEKSSASLTHDDNQPIHDIFPFILDEEKTSTEKTAEPTVPTKLLVEGLAEEDVIPDLYLYYPAFFTPSYQKENPSIKIELPLPLVKEKDSEKENEIEKTASVEKPQETTANTTTKAIMQNTNIWQQAKETKKVAKQNLATNNETDAKLQRASRRRNRQQRSGREALFG